MKNLTTPILIGTCGWSYPEWIGTFYPSKLASYKDLAFYAEHFPTVENNSAFYHMPQKATIQKWINATPDDFIFSVKLNRQITHIHRLAMNAETKELLKTYFDSVGQLKQKLGAILIQLPASFKVDLAKLKNFLHYYTTHYPVRTTIEFRHQGWFNKDTYALLKTYNVALTIAQSSRYPLDKIVTADFMYIRFHGPKELFRSAYSDKDMAAWAEFIKDYAKTSKMIYVYFNNTAGPNAINNAHTLRSMLTAVL